MADIIVALVNGWCGAGEIDELYRKFYDDLAICAYRPDGMDDPIVAVVGPLAHSGYGWSMHLVDPELLMPAIPKVRGVRRFQLERAIKEAGHGKTDDSGA